MGNFFLKCTTECFYIIYIGLRCTLAERESNSLTPRAVVPGAFLFAYDLRKRMTERTWR
jgi:hypothetical protein